MPRLVQIASSIIFLFSISISAQTGPAGVGTSANNVLWLKANAGISSAVNNAPIATWADQSGNGIDVTQTVAVQQPSFTTNIINGFPSILFDNSTTSGQNDKMIGPDSPLLDNTTGYTFFTVTRPQNFGDAHVVVSKRTGVSIDQSFMLFFYTSNKMTIDIQTTNDRFSSNTTFSVNTNYIIDLTYDGSVTTASRCVLYSEETLDKYASETSTMVPDNSSPLLIGTTDASDPRPFGGYMSEIIMYREALIPTKRIIVNNYLSSKYNIALSANDKYLGDNTTNGDYDFDVAGIGQESTGSNTSFSANISGGLTISSNSGLDNTDYVLAGHAVLNNSVTTTDVGGIIGITKARWLRIWYIDVTNTSTNINTNIEFDMSDGGMGAVTLGVVGNYVLLYRSGQTGNWTELTTASSVTGDRVQFNNVTLTNDGYYTIGTRDYNNSPLPIELVFFKAQAEQDHVNISWETASERNTNYFLIEKTQNGSDFETVATVAAAGESNSLKNYQTVDQHPYPGVSYYRLTELTKNNVATSYPLAIVSFDGDDDFIIYPNPTDNLLNIQTAVSSNTSIHLTVTDISGKTCFEKTLITKTKNETLQLETKPVLSSGTYLFSITVAGKTIERKIILK